MSDEHPRFKQRRMEILREEERRLIAEYGYVVHSVIGEGHHTHGLTQNFELMLWIPPEIAYSIIRYFSLQKNLQPGKYKVPPEIASCEIAIERRGDHLRIILPDPDGNLSPSATSPFGEQWLP